MCSFLLPLDIINDVLSKNMTTSVINIYLIIIKHKQKLKDFSISVFFNDGVGQILC